MGFQAVFFRMKKRRMKATRFQINKPKSGVNKSIQSILRNDFSRDTASSALCVGCSMFFYVRRCARQLHKAIRLI
jgi:hypothetical protein